VVRYIGIVLYCRIEYNNPSITTTPYIEQPHDITIHFLNRTTPQYNDAMNTLASPAVKHSNGSTVGHVACGFFGSQAG